ncbi:MAG: membrane-bound lytic murein transglycosylase MltF [Spongiibacteraceae bacterium]
MLNLRAHRRLFPLPLRSSLLVLLIAWLTGCSNSDRLQDIRESGVLRVLTRNGPTTYFEDRHGPTGLEYELARRFAREIGVELRIETEPSYEEIFDAVDKGRVDLAAAGLAITPSRAEIVLFGPSYQEIQHVVVVRADRVSPKSAADLVGLRLHIAAGSSRAETLKQLQTALPGLTWSASSDVETIDLLEQLDAGQIDATIINSDEFIANRGFYTNLRAAFNIGASSQLAWAIARGPDSAPLEKALQTFFDKLRASGELAQLIERFAGHNQDNSQRDSIYFAESVNKILPRHRDMIEQVADDYDMDWRLLAAVSYAESGWNPAAISPTGVRGMMMLTNATAKAMGIENRENTLQSLRGGARYLRTLRQELPDRINEPDRTWLTLAAYNIGMGHLEDARKLTQNLGKDPDKWTDVKEALPLLAKRQYYEKAKHGYVQGREPVRYVQAIRYYYNLLTWNDIAKQRTPPAKSTREYLPENFDATLDAL